MSPPSRLEVISAGVLDGKKLEPLKQLRQGMHEEWQQAYNFVRAGLPENPSSKWYKQVTPAMIHGLAPSRYALLDDMEWFAECFVDYCRTSSQQYWLAEHTPATAALLDYVAREPMIAGHKIPIGSKWNSSIRRWTFEAKASDI